jgi:hypothetical protein
VTEAEGLTASPGKSDYAIELYPNPAADFVNIEIPQNNGKVQLTVYSPEGKMLRSELLSQPSTQLEVSQLKSGIYLLRFEKDGEIINKRLVIY